MSFYTQDSIKAVHDALTAIENITTRDPRFAWKQLQGRSEFGYYIRTQGGSNETFIPISNPDLVRVTQGGVSYRVSNRSSKVDESPVVDPTSPDAVGERRVGLYANQGANTILDMFEQINNAKSPRGNWSVDGEYAQLALVCFGLENTT